MSNTPSSSPSSPSSSAEAPSVQHSRRRGGAFRGFALAVAILVIAAVGVLSVRHYVSGLATTPGETRVDIGGPFELVDHTGATVTDVDFRGRYMLVYFGYTYCPDICPTSLMRNMQALDRLGLPPGTIVPVLISVDPQRDTPEHLRDYVELFGGGLVALTGSSEQVAAAASAYRVYYQTVEDPGGAPDAYLIDHSSFTYLIDGDGAFVTFFRHDITPEKMADGLRDALG